MERREGRVAYEQRGDGLLAVCVPGMGDVRSVYRFLAASLAEQGFRVACVDLRGHGDSDVTFTAYDDVAAGTDVVALVERLGGPAVLIGNSMGAGAVCWSAAERPDLVAGLVLLGPFVRNGDRGVLANMLFSLALLRPWGRVAWRAYFRTLYASRRDAEFDAHFAEVDASLRKPGHWDAFRATTHTSHAPVEARLDDVHAPTLVVMGDADPDFQDPAAEAGWVAARLDGEVLMVRGAGHYPQAEFPEVVSPAVIEFARRITEMDALAHPADGRAQGRSRTQPTA